MSNPRQPVLLQSPLDLPGRTSGRRGFSLVEVVLAIGVVSFAMMAMLGTLPIGLKSSQQSRGQVATANIARQLQGELQQISFRADSDDSLSIGNLSATPLYYTLEGTRTSQQDAYYVASFAVSGVSVPGLAIKPEHARSVTVTLSYPAGVSPQEQQRSVFSLLLAKQKTD